MSFCRYSTEFVASSHTEVDNIFINDYLPFAPGEFVKVYLYGLYRCKDMGSANTIDDFCKALNMKEEDVMSAFDFWQEQGLVQVLKSYPVEIRYVPLKNLISATKLYKPEKYETFNRQAQEIFEGRREISKTEYGEYYDFLERFHMESDALLMIMKYCVDCKSGSVGYNYILTVAKNWANEGILTTGQVEERLKTFEQKDSEISQICKALGLRREAYVEEKKDANKWMSAYGFNIDTIIYVANSLKKKNRGNFANLDSVLSRYYEMKLLSVLEIEEFEKNKEKLFTLAKEINKNLGLYYQSLDVVVENYVLKWINLGFDEKVLLEIASYCFKNSIRTLDGMDNAIMKFHRLGITTLQALMQYFDGVLAVDNSIKQILEKLELKRNVNFIDRECYRTWHENWNFGDDVILYACSLAQGKNMPMQYLGKILSTWHEQGVTNVDQAKKFSFVEPQTKSQKQNFTGRSYSREELNALFDSINEIEI